MATLTNDRCQAILQIAAQVDLQITELAEQVQEINERLEQLRTLSAQIFQIQEGELSDDEVQAMIRQRSSMDSSPFSMELEQILDEIIQPQAAQM